MPLSAKPFIALRARETIRTKLKFIGGVVPFCLISYVLYRKDLYVLSEDSEYCPTSPILFFFFLRIVLSHWNFSVRKFRLFSPGKASCDRVELPNVRCIYWMF